jgi:hypothetical protein
MFSVTVSPSQPEGDEPPAEGLPAEHLQVETLDEQPKATAVEDNEVLVATNEPTVSRPHSLAHHDAWPALPCPILCLRATRLHSF